MVSSSLLVRSQARPHIIVVLAMSADGKIADAQRSPARFGSATDKSHLETQLAQVDAVLFGAGTLRAYGTTLKITSPLLLQQRQQQGKPPQPVHMVCSHSAQLDPRLPFFQQPVPRWLLTTPSGAAQWQPRLEFEQVLTFAQSGPSGQSGAIDWVETLRPLLQWGIERVAVTGGGELVAAFLEADLVDEFWLTVCPLILGGATAPTPVMGHGFVEGLAPRLELISAEVIGQEVFLHYRRQRSQAGAASQQKSASG
jgi:5-amino-6-(5-phosphoribosylamino)uracil reductase